LSDSKESEEISVPSWVPVESKEKGIPVSTTVPVRDQEREDLENSRNLTKAEMDRAKRFRERKPCQTVPKVDFESVCDIPELQELQTMTIDDWVQEQSKDPVLNRVRELIVKHLWEVPKEILKTEPAEVQAYLHQGKCIRVIEGVLIKELYTPQIHDCVTETGNIGECSECKLGENDLFIQKIVPRHMRIGLFRVWHGKKEQGHFCYKRTYPIMRERYYWMGMARDIKLWLRGCDSCQRIKHMGKHKPKLPIRSEVATAPMERMSVDVMGPWPITTSGNRFIVIYQDYFSKWVEIFPVRQHTAVIVAELLVKQIVSRYGAVTCLHSDQGPEFESAVYQETCQLWGIKKTRTAPYTPWSNGMLERVNMSIKTMVKHYVDSSYSTWDRFLPFLRMAYNFSIHDSTKCTPFKLFFSRCCDPKLPLDLIYGRLTKEQQYICRTAYCEEQKLKGQRIFDVVRKTLKRTMEIQGTRYDRQGVKLKHYEPGEMVLREYPPLSQNKLGPKYQGPWVVMGMVDTHNVEICRGGDPIIVHVTCLKPYRVQELN